MSALQHGKQICVLRIHLAVYSQHQGEPKLLSAVLFPDDTGGVLSCTGRKRESLENMANYVTVTDI